MVNTKELNIDVNVQKEVINQLKTMLRENYIFPDVAENMVKWIDERDNKGEYYNLNNAESLSKELTKDLQDVSKDKHLCVTFTHQDKSTDQKKSMDQMLEEYKKTAIVQNYGFYHVDRLPGNVGYIELREFFDPEIAGDTAAHAMNFITNTEALIFDLRKNRGGYPDMVSLLISYLLDGKPVHINNFYDREEGTVTQSWTYPYVQGKRFSKKPVYVLTSQRTASAGEEFTYDLKNLKRAIIIGERTRGAANPGTDFQLSKNFRAFIPTGRAENPITKTNWEGVGVEPDIAVSKEDSFNIAYIQSLKHVIKKYKDDEEIYHFLVKEADRELSKIEGI